MMLALGGTLAGCLDRPIRPADSRLTSTSVDVVGQSSVDKIDLLLVVDNSGSMADKQDILASAVPQLVRRLVTPVCIDPETGLADDTPVNIDSDGKCPKGFRPEFPPIADINIGIVSSSIGSVGSPTCAVTETTPTTRDDAHLLHRTDPRDPSSSAPTWEDRGFLAWDPFGKRPCPGEGPGGEVCPGLADPDELIDTLTTMVKGVGEYGCGYEAPLEAAYRFLVDPEPWQEIVVNDGSVEKQGVDDDLLAERKDFLRPDSLLAVIVLTDENDCSFRVDNAGGYAANGQLKMPRARSECAADPDSKCCVSCWEVAPDECEGDGGCAEPGNQQNPDNYYPDPGDEGENDSVAKLRCWDQKRRFGTDFLYPIDRYVNAFSAPRIDPERSDLQAGEQEGIDNPLFLDIESQTKRPSNQAFFAGIVGVPWQLVARKDEGGVPSLEDGLDPQGAKVGGFQTFAELGESKAWDLLVPENAADQPDSRLMIESPYPRETSAEEKAINGGEWDTLYQDLQYACIFELTDDCDPGPDDPSCADCGDASVAGNGNPLCDPEKLTRQTHAKAYPGTRVLQVLEGLEEQGITASICPGEETDVNAKSYGYTPAVFAIIERLKATLLSSCQPRPLAVDGEFNAPCVVIEASDSDGDRDAGTTGSCAAVCKEAGRAPIGKDTQVAADAVRDRLAGEDTAVARSFDCLCAIEQLEGKPSDDDWESSDRYLCQYESYPPEGVDGWCYVDATRIPAIGSADLPELAQCTATEKRLVRPVGNAVVKPGGRQFVTCAGDVVSND